MTSRIDPESPLPIAAAAALPPAEAGRFSSWFSAGTIFQTTCKVALATARVLASPKETLVKAGAAAVARIVPRVSVFGSGDSKTRDAAAAYLYTERKVTPLADPKRSGVLVREKTVGEMAATFDRDGEALKGRVKRLCTDLVCQCERCARLLKKQLRQKESVLKS